MTYGKIFLSSYLLPRKTSSKFQFSSSKNVTRYGQITDYDRKKLFIFKYFLPTNHDDLSNKYFTYIPELMDKMLGKLAALILANQWQQM